ncbi:hypothetical protein VKT23_019584 [Stygiomarasmius scandens]|uniref:DUF6533 domain-containing protein n=1 Tax=Marasmiellus scandens TaxID=2682957 RepID=A0ABR1IPE8_9AGAR
MLPSNVETLTVGMPFVFIRLPTQRVPSMPSTFTLVELAEAAQTSRYVAIGSLMVLVWDILTNLDDEIEIYSGHKFGVPTVVYLLSRIASLACAVNLTLYLGNQTPKNMVERLN